LYYIILLEVVFPKGFLKTVLFLVELCKLTHKKRTYADKQNVRTKKANAHNIGLAKMGVTF
jgi:hypothetical protein